MLTEGTRYKQAQDEAESLLEEKTRELYEANILLQKKNVILIDTIEALKDTQKQLIQAEKLSSLGQLVAGIAHEINNPIAFINSNFDLLRGYFSRIIDYSNQLEGTSDIQTESLRKLKEEFDLDYISQNYAKLLNNTDDGIKRIIEIVSSLKTFSRTDDLQKSKFDINESIEKALSIIWNQIKYDCNIKKKFNKLPTFTGLEQQITQVFINLLMNAYQSLDKNREITISTMFVDHKIIVTITDTGIGIAEENIEKIFDPFYTTKSVGVGTGLGLSVVYGIIENHHGEVKVRSQLESGTELTLELPILDSRK